MDGKVARVEYTTGFDAFRSCMDAEGFELHSLREVGGILEFSIPDEAVQSGVESRCYQTHFAFVDATWQFEHTEERAFIERVSGCIGLDQGDVAEPLTTRVDAERALSEAGRQVADCP